MAMRMLVFSTVAVVMVEAVDREVLMVGGRVEVETMAQEAVAAPLRCG